MFKRVIIPTFFSLILKFVLAACVFWVFNGWWEAYITGDGNRLGYNWLIADVAANDDPSTNKDDALDFIAYNINPTIYYGYLIDNSFIFIWLLLGRLLKVDKPGVAKRYKFYWFIIAILCSVVFAGNCYYWLYFFEGEYYLLETTIYKFCGYMLVSTFILFWIQSLLFTSRVMYIAVPFVGLVKRISFRK